MNKPQNVLGIDWGTKYIGMAYVNKDWGVIMPIGSLMNDWWLFFNIWDILTRYNITKIVVGYPKKQKDIQQKIDKFIESLSFVVGTDMEIIRQDEDYTSVEAGATTWIHTKDEAQDTVAAMKILERWISKN